MRVGRKCILLVSRGPDPGVGRAVLPPGALGRSLLTPFPLRVALGVPWPVARPPVSAVSSRGSSPMSLCPFLSYEDAPGGFRAHPHQASSLLYPC